MIVPIAVLADFANVTLDGKLNVMGIFDTIYAASVPVEVSSMRVVMQLQTEPHDRGATLTLALQLLDPRGDEILPHPLQRFIAPAELSARVNHPQIVELQGTSFFAFGAYTFVILVNDEVKARIPFHVEPLPVSSGR